MQCPNHECGAAADAGTAVRPSRGTGAGTLANMCLALGVLACVLPWAGSAELEALGWRAEWRAPFLGTLLPLSHAPHAALKALSLLPALAAVAMGHLALLRGGGTRRSLAVAVTVCLLAGLFVLCFGPVGRLLSPVIPYYAAFAPFALLAAAAAFAVVQSIAGVGRVRVPGGVAWRPVPGALLGYFNITLVLLVTLSLHTKGRHNLDMAACAGNLRRIEAALDAYAAGNGGRFPPLPPRPGVLMFAPDMLPGGEELLSALTCPTARFAAKGMAAEKAARMGTPPADDQSYYYLGYALRSEAALEAFATAYRRGIAGGGGFTGDLVLEDAGGVHTLHRLAENSREVLRASPDSLAKSPYEGQSPGYHVPCVTDDVPILIERDLGHRNIDAVDAPPAEGAWVLYLNDGPCFIARGTWPVTEKTQRLLAELAE